MTAEKAFNGKLHNIGSVCTVFALSLSCVADQWWVGDASGDWSGNNWASAADGTGAAWTSGGTGWFTHSPVTIDLNGASPSVARFKTSGFSADNRCEVNIVNSSSAASVLTFSGLNRDKDNDFAFADMIFNNVAVEDTSTWGFEINGGSHWYFGEGSSYTKPNRNSEGHVYVGRFSATSNMVTVAKNATMAVNQDLFIGCCKYSNVASTGVVYVAGTLRPDRNLMLGRATDNKNDGSPGRGVLIVDGGLVEINGSVEIGSLWKSSQSYRQTSEIVVRNDGIMTVKGGFTRYEWSAGQTIVLDGGTLRVSGQFKCQNGDSTPKNVVQNAQTTVKNGGVFALGDTFIPNNTIGGNDVYLFDGGTFRAMNNISANTQSPADFTVGEGGMTMDTNGYDIKWYTSINKGSGKVSKVGAGTMYLQSTPYNLGGWEVSAGVLCIDKDIVNNKDVYARVNSGALTVLDGGTLKNGASNKPTNGLADTIVLKEGSTVSASVDTTAQCIFGGDIAVEGAVNVAFDGELQESVDYPVLTKTGDSTFTDADATRCRPVAGTAHAGQVRFRCSSDGKTIYARRVKGFVILFR